MVSFRQWNKSKLKKRDLIRIEIRYFEDGGMESQVKCKEDGKWENVATTFGETTPSWDKLHKCQYIGEGENCFNPPWPVSAIIAQMKSVVHRFGIDERRAALARDA